MENDSNGKFLVCRAGVPTRSEKTDNDSVGKTLTCNIGKPFTFEVTESKLDIESVKTFVGQLTASERNIIRKQLSRGYISNIEIETITSSQHDIMGFLEQCKELSDLEKALVLNTIPDLVDETRSNIMSILDNSSNTSVEGQDNKYGFYKVDDLVGVPSLSGRSQEVLKISSIDYDEGTCIVQAKGSLEKIEVELSQLVYMKGLGLAHINS